MLSGVGCDRPTLSTARHLAKEGFARFELLEVLHGW
jgi:hypothetical protein